MNEFLATLKLNIYLLYCKEPTGYDEYDSFMVVAESEKDALDLILTETERDEILSDKYKNKESFGIGAYVEEPLANFGILYIGKSVLHKKQILIGSFNRA